MYKRTDGGAIVAEDDAEYQKILALRQRNKKNAELETRLNKVEADMAQMRQLLRELVDVKSDCKCRHNG